MTGETPTDSTDKESTLARIAAQERRMGEAEEEIHAAEVKKDKAKQALAELYSTLTGEVLLAEGRTWGFVDEINGGHYQHFKDWTERYIERSFSATRVRILEAGNEGVILQAVEADDSPKIICNYGSFWHPTENPPEVDLT